MILGRIILESKRKYSGTPSGSEAPSWPRCQRSSRCGSPSRSTTSLALPSSTGSASRPSSSWKYFVELVSYCQQLELYLSQINIVKKFKSKPGVSVSIHPGLLFLLRRLFACFSHLPRRAQVTVFSLGASDSFLFVVFESLLVLRKIFLRKRTRL